jgi:hypothetical protein
MEGSFTSGKFHFLWKTPGLCGAQGLVPSDEFAKDIKLF